MQRHVDDLELGLKGWSSAGLEAENRAVSMEGFTFDGVHQSSISSLEVENSGYSL